MACLSKAAPNRLVCWLPVTPIFVMSSAPSARAIFLRSEFAVPHLPVGKPTAGHRCKISVVEIPEAKEKFSAAQFGSDTGLRASADSLFPFVPRDIPITSSTVKTIGFGRFPMVLRNFLVMINLKIYPAQLPLARDQRPLPPPCCRHQPTRANTRPSAPAEPLDKFNALKIPPRVKKIPR